MNGRASPNNDLDGRASSASDLVGRASPDTDLDGRGKQLLVTRFPDGTLTWRGLSVTVGRIKSISLDKDLNCEHPSIAISTCGSGWHGEGIQAGTLKESSQTYS